MVESTLLEKMLLIKVALDEDFYHKISIGKYQGIADGVVKEIVERIYPEMEKRIMSDPTFKDRIINEVLIMIANKIADKKLNEKNSIH